MHVSAETRWFWPHHPPEGLKRWFCEADEDSCAAGGGSKTRCDKYSHDPNQVELGLKVRDGKAGVEIKGLVEVIRDGLKVDPFSGPIELWTKWTSESLQLPEEALIPVEKQRWLRLFDTTATTPEEIPLGSDEKPLNGRPLPARGCTVELTRVTLSKGRVWWTLGFESFGSIRTVEHDLRAAAAVLGARRPPTLEHGILSSYPTWLTRVTVA